MANVEIPGESGTVTDSQSNSTLPSLLQRQTRISEERPSESVNFGSSGRLQINNGESSTATRTAVSQNRFDELASQQGHRPWNRTDFDDRWLLQSGEVWNIDPRTRSTRNIAPDSVASGMESAQGVVNPAQAPEVQDRTSHTAQSNSSQAQAPSDHSTRNSSAQGQQGLPLSAYPR